MSQRFRSNYYRMAYIVMEQVAAGRTQQELADELKLSVQRISQITASGFAGT